MTSEQRNIFWTLKKENLKNAPKNIDTANSF